MTSLPDYDVVIAGGGMTGASLAVALAGENIRIAIIEAVSPRSDDQPSYDDRGLALSLSSQRVLQGLNLWEKVSATSCPVQHVHVSDQHHFGFVRLHAEAMSIPALGYVVVARELGRILLEKINSANNIDLICPASIEDIVIQTDRAVINLKQGNEDKLISGRLLVAADGSHSTVCRFLGIKASVKDYGQTAIVTNVTPARKHLNTAWERFTPQGPLALLPLTDDRCAVVFTVSQDEVEAYMTMKDADFLDQLQCRFGRRLGKFHRLGKRKSYVMQLIISDEQVRERVVVLGNSAHTIHPNGAQGFNLCLRDVAGLAEILLPAFRSGIDLGKRRILNQYQDLRECDQKNVIQFTDGLTRLFYNDLLHKVLFRNIGMLLMDMMPSCKKTFMQRAMGMHGHQPVLVRGTPVCP